MKSAKDMAVEFQDEYYYDAVPYSPVEYDNFFRDGIVSLLHAYGEQVREECATVAENEPVVLDLNALRPQKRAAISIRAIKLP